MDEPPRPKPTRSRGASTSARFWSKVEECGECWIWRGALKKNGYGNFGVKGRTYHAHRWAYEEMIGSIPEGLTVDHLCRNRACVNPYHMDPVPLAVNLARAMPFRPAVTHCPSGHGYTDENTVTRDGKRYCLTCERQRGRARAKNPGIGRGGHQLVKTHCPQDHPYDEQNTYYEKNGGRKCRICAQAATARYRARKQERAA